MRKYLIERAVPGLGTMTEADLAGLSSRSNAVLAELGPEVQWLQSYVTDDKLVCVYYADGADVIREHARRGGFPCDNITPVGTVIDPTTAG